MFYMHIYSMTVTRIFTIPGQFGNLTVSLYHCRIMALRSNLRTPLEEDPGNGKHRNGDEAEKARCPAGT